jgi:hypothetical protein
MKMKGNNEKMGVILPSAIHYYPTITPKVNEKKLR